MTSVDEVADPACEPPGPLGRVVRVVLAIYLIPVLLAVALVAVIGLLGVALARPFGRAARPAVPPPHLLVEANRIHLSR